MTQIIRITGKLSKDFICNCCEQPQGSDKQATIELPPVNLQDIKAGDKVYVEMIVPLDHTDTFLTKKADKILAHFPQEKFSPYMQGGNAKTATEENLSPAQPLRERIVNIIKKEYHGTIMVNCERCPEIADAILALIKPMGEEKSKFPKQFPISACCNASVSAVLGIPGGYKCQACGQSCMLTDWNKLPQEKPKERIGELCGICGSKQVWIRGRYPHTDERLVCPTCCQEKLEQIRDISDKDYGKSSQNK